MVATLIITLITCLGIVVTSVAFPSIKIKKFNLNLYWAIALLGAIIILVTGLLPFNELWEGLTNKNSINPFQILILFLSMSVISIFLDELGFFTHVAYYVLKKTGEKQIGIFIVFYLLVAVLTMFTSNDIVILTLTPFIIFFCRAGRISPLPYLVSEFICANTWSMMFEIGNPTNIYLSESFHISFVEYFLVMAVPTLLAGIAEFFILLLLFRKSLKERIQHPEIKLDVENIPLTVIGLVVLFLCTLFLILSSYIDLPMYLISFVSLCLLVISVLLYSVFSKHKPVEIFRSLKRAPYELIPFILGMFTLVLALKKYEITFKMFELFSNGPQILTYGYSSLLMANLINNIPMTVTYSAVISSYSSYAYGAIYSSIAGSNIGAFLTPIGALAGIMWMSILKTHGIRYTFLDFIKYGFIVGIPTITVCLLTLFLFV